MTYSCSTLGRGSFCPGPLMELTGWIKLAAVGDELELLSTDKGSASDVPEWFLVHALHRRLLINSH